MGATHIDQGGLQRVFYSLMVTLNCSISRGMIHWGEFHLNVELLHEILVEIRDESVPIVGNCYARNTKPRYPLEETLTDLGTGW